MQEVNNYVCWNDWKLNQNKAIECMLVGIHGISHGIRPEAGKCKGLQAGTGRASVGFLRSRSSRGSRQGYKGMYRGVSLSILLFIKTPSLGDASCWQFNSGRPRWLISSDMAWKSEVLGSNPGRVRCLSSRLCIYSAPNFSKAWTRSPSISPSIRVEYI